MEIDTQFLETIGVLGTAVATILLVILLWKAIKQMEATVEVSRVQTNLRFRAWVGPKGGIEFDDEVHNKQQLQYKIVVKNFGEIVAEEVTIYYKKDSKIMSKDVLNESDIEKFNLGPVLPNMEKNYWFFVNSEDMNKIKNNEKKLFVLLYFEYNIPSGKSGYGMISEYDTTKDLFKHRKMWVDNPKDIF